MLHAYLAHRRKKVHPILTFAGIELLGNNGNKSDSSTCSGASKVVALLQALHYINYDRNLAPLFPSLSEKILFPKKPPFVIYGQKMVVIGLEKQKKQMKDEIRL